MFCKAKTYWKIQYPRSAEAEEKWGPRTEEAMGKGGYEGIRDDEGGLEKGWTRQYQFRDYMSP